MTLLIKNRWFRLPLLLLFISSDLFAPVQETETTAMLQKMKRIQTTASPSFSIEKYAFFTPELRNLLEILESYPDLIRPTPSLNHFINTLTSLQSLPPLAVPPTPELPTTANIVPETDPILNAIDTLFKTGIPQIKPKETTPREQAIPKKDGSDIRDGLASLRQSQVYSEQGNYPLAARTYAHAYEKLLQQNHPLSEAAKHYANAVSEHYQKEPAHQNIRSSYARLADTYLKQLNQSDYAQELLQQRDYLKESFHKKIKAYQSATQAYQKAATKPEQIKAYQTLKTAHQDLKKALKSLESKDQGTQTDVRTEQLPKQDLVIKKQVEDQAIQMSARSSLARSSEKIEKLKRTIENQKKSLGTQEATIQELEKKTKELESKATLQPKETEKLKRLELKLQDNERKKEAMAKELAELQLKLQQAETEKEQMRNQLEEANQRLKNQLENHESDVRAILSQGETSARRRLKSQFENLKEQEKAEAEKRRREKEEERRRKEEEERIHSERKTKMVQKASQKRSELKEEEISDWDRIQKLINDEKQALNQRKKVTDLLLEINLKIKEKGLSEYQPIQKFIENLKKSEHFSQAEGVASLEANQIANAILEKLNAQSKTISEEFKKFLEKIPTTPKTPTTPRTEDYSHFCNIPSSSDLNQDLELILKNLEKLQEKHKLSDKIDTLKHNFDILKTKVFDTYRPYYFNTQEPGINPEDTNHDEFRFTAMAKNKRMSADEQTTFKQTIGTGNNHIFNCIAFLEEAEKRRKEHCEKLKNGQDAFEKLIFSNQKNECPGNLTQKIYYNINCSKSKKGIPCAYLAITGIQYRHKDDKDKDKYEDKFHSLQIGIGGTFKNHFGAINMLEKQNETQPPLLQRWIHEKGTESTTEYTKNSFLEAQESIADNLASKIMKTEEPPLACSMTKNHGQGHNGNKTIGIVPYQGTDLASADLNLDNVKERKNLLKGLEATVDKIRALAKAGFHQRDIKPENVFYNEAHSKPFDFGAFVFKQPDFMVTGGGNFTRDVLPFNAEQSQINELIQQEANYMKLEMARRIRFKIDQTSTTFKEKLKEKRTAFESEKTHQPNLTYFQTGLLIFKQLCNQYSDDIKESLDLIRKANNDSQSVRAKLDLKEKVYDKCIKKYPDQKENIDFALTLLYSATVQNSDWNTTEKKNKLIELCFYKKPLKKNNSKETMNACDCFIKSSLNQHRKTQACKDFESNIDNIHQELTTEINQNQDQYKKLYQNQQMKIAFSEKTKALLKSKYDSSEKTEISDKLLDVEAKTGYPAELIYLVVNNINLEEITDAQKSEFNQLFQQDKFTKRFDPPPPSEKPKGKGKK